MCAPCPKCAMLKNLIDQALKGIEMQTKTKITYEFKHTPHLKEVSKYSVNPALAPIIIINGHVELTGRATLPLIRQKLESLHRG